jgi:alkanesulfonate monooxygenase
VGLGVQVVPVKERFERLEETLQICLQMWSDSNGPYQGAYYQLAETLCVPAPLSRPRPPILIGGYVDAVLKRAATKGDGWLTYFYTPESYTKAWGKIVGFAREAGRDPKTLSGTNQLAIYIGRSREATEAPMRRWLETEWDVAAWSESTIEHAIRGSADECVAQLRAHIDSGVDRLVLIPYRYEPEQVELIARDILPRLTR